MKYVKYFLSQCIFPLFYSAIMLFLGLAIKLISDDLMWLKYLLFVVVFGFYAVMICSISFKDGQNAVKIQHANDVERLNIIRTGEDRSLDLVQEYKPWKGFVSGLVVSSPVIILLILQAIFMLAGTEVQWPGAVAGYVYFVFFMFLLPGKKIDVPKTYYFWSIIAVPIMMLLMGVPYLLGARKQKLIYENIKDKHKEIYGE